MSDKVPAESVRLPESVLELPDNIVIELPLLSITKFVGPLDGHSTAVVVRLPAFLYCKVLPLAYVKPPLLASTAVPSIESVPFIVTAERTGIVFVPELRIVRLLNEIEIVFEEQLLFPERKIF